MKHIVIQPSPVPNTVDFVRQDIDVSGVWFRQPTPQWVANILPDALASAGRGADLTFSTFRAFGFTDPDLFTIPSGGNFVAKVFLPLGPKFGAGMWGCLSYFDASRPPVASADRFMISDGGLRKQLAKLFEADAINELRELAKRPRYEVWVRHDWDASKIAPGAFSLPGWAEILNDPEARAKQARARQPMKPEDYTALRARERAERAAAEAQASGSPEPMPAKPLPAEPDPAPAPAPHFLDREEIVAARAKREKAHRTTQKKVKADAFNETAAAAHAAKTVKRLEKAGKL